MERRLVRILKTATIAAALVTASASGAFADGGGGGGDDGPRRGDSAPPSDPQYTEGIAAVKRGDYPTAIRLFESVTARDERNADAYNWLAYSTRKSGDAARAIAIYEKALAIEPKHRGAHEYIGGGVPRPRRPRQGQGASAGARQALLLSLRGVR